jgi:hypothetical protein
LVSEQVPSRKQFNHWKEIMDTWSTNVHMNGVQLFSMNGVPMFNGQNGLDYELWSRRMKTFLQAHGYDVWHSVVTGYNATKKPKTATKKELKRTTK